MFQSFTPAADKSYAGAHLPPLRSVLAAQGLDGFLVPHDDEYLNEYLPAYAERLMWVSGFSGSAGSAIILKDKAAVFSDGRYTIQLKAEVDTAYFTLHNSETEKPADWLSDHAANDMVVGYDPLLFSEAGLAPYLAAAKKAGFTLRPCRPNPIDKAWTDQPSPPMAPIVPHPLEFAGETSTDKRARLAKTLREQRADAALLTAPPSLAWLFNIRGRDVHATPLPLGRALLMADGTAHLFVATAKVSEELADHLGPDIELREETEIEEALKALGTANKTVLIDPALTPLLYATQLAEAGATLLKAPDPCALPRATKNSVEREGARTAHARDGVAVARFLHWLAVNGTSGTNTEISAAQQLETFRRETNALEDISFDTISGSGGNGAIVHYRVTTDTDQPLVQDSLFLVDSGGQYKDGTTDITRTIAVGTPSEEMRRHYTLVLKGHIALATARFPAGTAGLQLDALARRPLWEAGLDYGHGTGHGVGSYLGVHEGPQNISKRPIHQALMPGMICSNEPGYYVEGAYGIRIENLIIVTEEETVDGGATPMMGFETITLAPFDRKLIDKGLLTEGEVNWVDSYHMRVKQALLSQLASETAQWLAEATAPL